MRVRRRSRMLAFSLAMLTSLSSLTVLPVQQVSAAQQNAYHDPLEHWVTAGSRTNELDTNALVTTETIYCQECDADTLFTVFRTPEYTKDGVSALDQDIIYSDGVRIDCQTQSVLREGKVYTGYHWTKSVCRSCSGLNTNTSRSTHAYGRNLYMLYDCSEKFRLNLPETRTCEEESGEYHKLTVKNGYYCGMCYGTTAAVSSTLEPHHLSSEVTPDPSGNRFVQTEKCNECGYSHSEYLAAKYIIQDYYGAADGKDHTVTGTNLSDSSVKVDILYGESAEECSSKDPAAYQKPGYYSVYYRILYTYENCTMSENGTARVILTGSSGAGGVSGNCGCDDPDCTCGDSDCDGSNCDKHCQTHDYKWKETVDPTCETGGYDRYECTKCGHGELRNETDPLGHDWEETVIRQNDCTTTGKMIRICKRCGKAESEITPKGSHQYKTKDYEATCTSPGYSARECSVCGDRVITRISAALPHDYKAHKNDASCTTGGHTTHLCEGCGSSFITDYKDALGHSMNEGSTISGPTCLGQGVTLYECIRCGHQVLDGQNATGHHPGPEATCTDPQLCTECGSVIKSALGHDFESSVVDPSCESMGYTLMTCRRCRDFYKTDYTNPTGHKAGEWIIDREATEEQDGLRHKECQVCSKVLETEVIKYQKNNESKSDDSGKDNTKDDPDSSSDKDSDSAIEHHNIYVYGYPDGSFHPEGNMTRAEAAAVFARLLGAQKNEPVPAGNGSNTGYRDIKAGQWYVGYVQYLSGYEIITGESDGRFRPGDRITRSELTAIAAKFFRETGKQPSQGAIQYSGSSFNDVSRDHWASGYIDEAYQNGWIRGYEDGSFRGDSPITRAEMVSITNRMLSRSGDSSYIQDNGGTVTAFSDVNRSHWAYYEIMEASNTHRSMMAEEEQWIRTY